VFLHVGFLVEPFAAVLARIRPGVRVDQQVSRQRRRPLERLAALPTFEHFFRVVQRPNLWREKRKRPFFYFISKFNNRLDYSSKTLALDILLL